MKLIGEQKGIALIIAVVFAMTLSVIAFVLLRTHLENVQSAEKTASSSALLYIAESGLQKALYEVIEGDIAGSLPETGSDWTFGGEDGAITMKEETGTATTYLDEMPLHVTVSKTGTDQFLARATASMAYDGTKISGRRYNGEIVSASTKTLEATIGKRTSVNVSTVFDYVYFVNNWGWFFGNTINARGDVRSNGNFDFKYNPTVNGLGDVFIDPLPEGIFAADSINTYGGQVRGTANKQEDGVYVNQHAESDVLPMPNLEDLKEYEDLAISENASISIGGSVVVDGIYGDETGETGNVVLIGTTTNPIVINGPNVIRNDVILKGVITGRGTIYAGRNLYVAGDITYKNPPGKALPNESALDTYYDANAKKDLVYFAATESIVLGDYTSTEFSTNAYSAYLRNMGDEDVGKDGILGTDDEGEGDGVFDKATEDIDGDGVEDHYYTLSYFYPSSSLSTFGNLPAGVTKYSQIGSNTIKFLDGVFYTNHAMAGRVSNLTLFGAMVSKDEAIIFTTTFQLDYDVRIHSYFADRAGEDTNSPFPPRTESQWCLTAWKEVS